MSTAVTMSPAIKAKLDAYYQSLISTQTGADAATPAVPAPVDPPAPAKKSGGKKKAAAEPVVATTAAAPVPTGPVIVQPKPKAPPAPKPAPTAKPVSLEIRPWTGSRGEPWVTVALQGRHKGQCFAKADEACAWVDAIVRDAEALKAAFRQTLGG